jgi:hypothetical protein
MELVISFFFLSIYLSFFLYLFFLSFLSFPFLFLSFFFLSYIRFLSSFGSLSGSQPKLFPELGAAIFHAEWRCNDYCLFLGPSASLPMNPVLTGLIATAVGLLVVVCAVVVALYRRHQHRRRPRQAKLSQLEVALHQADDPASADGDCAGAGHTTPLNPAAASSGGVIVAGDHRSTEDTDPDIIPNKYGRLVPKHVTRSWF